MFLPLKPALLAASLVLIADGVPRFDVELFCRRIAAMAVALEEMEICLRKEREARDQLLQQWTQFPAADRSYCQQLTTTGLDPTYTELITCLELQRDARSLREKDAETAGTSAKPTSKPSGAQFDPDRTCGERREDRRRESSVLLRFARDAAGISSAQPPEADEERSPALISERGHNLGVTTSADSG